MRAAFKKAALKRSTVTGLLTILVVIMFQSIDGDKLSVAISF